MLNLNQTLSIYYERLTGMAQISATSKFRLNLNPALAICKRRAIGTGSLFHPQEVSLVRRNFIVMGRILKFLRGISLSSARPCRPCGACGGYR